MRCLRDETPLVVAGDPPLSRCPRCAGAWGMRPALEAAAGGPLFTRAASLILEDALPLDAPAAVFEGERCPSCRAGLRPEESRLAVGHEILACGACGRAWLDGPVLAAIAAHHQRAVIRARERPVDVPRPDAPALPRPGPLDTALPPLAAAVLAPRTELLLLPVAFVVAWGLVSTPYGELLSFVPRLQFHELGHAIAAWWSGRRALPLPIGFTVWSSDRSWLLVGLQALFTALLALHGVRERARVPLSIAVFLAIAIAVGVATPLVRSEPWVIAAGQIGETLLPALGVAAFHVPLPRRLRWDFWRWVVGLVALFALASAIRSGWQIAAGIRPLPYGSFLGERRDGDLNRLVDEYGWTEAGLRRLFGGLATLAFAIAFGTHVAVSGGRWWRTRAAR